MTSATAEVVIPTTPPEGVVAPPLDGLTQLFDVVPAEVAPLFMTESGSSTEGSICKGEGA